MYPEHRHTGFFCVVEKTVNILFLIVIIALFVMSLCAYCDLDIYTYEQTKTIKPHNIVNYSILVLMFAAAALLLYDFLNKVTLKATKPRRIVNSCILICAAVVLAIGLCWICFDESAPRFDQATIYEEARKLAGYLDAPFDADYMSLFKRQRGYTLLMAAVLRIFGDRQIYIKFVNLLGSIAILIGICKMAERIVKEKTCIVFTVFALTVYYPLITYASFLYGTLLSLAFAVWGFYAVVRYCETA